MPIIVAWHPPHHCVRRERREAPVQSVARLKPYVYNLTERDIAWHGRKRTLFPSQSAAVAGCGTPPTVYDVPPPAVPLPREHQSVPIGEPRPITHWSHFFPPASFPR